jgi:hypothetical protein
MKRTIHGLATEICNRNTGLKTKRGEVLQILNIICVIEAEDLVQNPKEGRPVWEILNTRVNEIASKLRKLLLK